MERIASVVEQLRANVVGRPEPRLASPRAVRVQAEVEAVVRAAGGPVRVRDVCEQLEAAGVRGYEKASVRKTLHDGSRGEDRRFSRVGWGLYESAGP